MAVDPFRIFYDVDYASAVVAIIAVGKKKAIGYTSEGCISIMRTIIIAQPDRSVAALLKEAQGENLILQLPDGSEFILAEIDSFNQEVKLTRENKPLIELLAQRRKQSKRVSLAEAKAQLGIDS